VGAPNGVAKVGGDKINYFVWDLEAAAVSLVGNKSSNAGTTGSPLNTI
jgi:hypothetical protein